MPRKKQMTGTRERFSFWLDLTKDDHFFLADLIHDLKQERAFSGTIRDGIRLICDLRAGRTDVLFELFPWVSDSAAGQGTNGATDDGLRQQVERLEQMLMQQSAGVKMQSVAGPKPLNMTKLAGPTEQDDSPSLTMKRTERAGDSAQNFLQSAMGLTQ